MPYIDGFIIPVPRDNRQAYLELCAKVHPIFLAAGATRIMEAVGDDLPAGKNNDFRTAAIAEADEEIFFSWIEWPDKATRDAGTAKVMADPALDGDATIPFAGARMIFGGFVPLIDTADQ